MIKYMVIYVINFLRNRTHPFAQISSDIHLMGSTDPYLVGGMPLVDLVDHLTLRGE